MKYPLKSIITVVFLCTFLRCNPDKLPKQLKPKEKREDSLDYITAWKLLFDAQNRGNKCLDENWANDSYSQHVELISNGNRECGGLSRLNTHIYNSTRQLISSKTITLKQDLLCANLKVQETFSNLDIPYTWYRVINTNPTTGEFIMKHSLQKDSFGNYIGIDSFTNYSKGDELLCCSNALNKDNPSICEKLKYE